MKSERYTFAKMHRAGIEPATFTLGRRWHNRKAANRHNPDGNVYPGTLVA